MMPPSADIANGFNAHVAAHNERVYGVSKRKFGQKSVKGNREITDFFSSSPMGAESSKIGGGVCESKKRKLNAVENYENEENASTGAKSAADSDKSPRKIASPQVQQPSHRSNSSNDNPQAKKVREDKPRNNREDPMLSPHDTDLEEAMMVDVGGLEMQGLMKKMVKRASVKAAQVSLSDAETSARERKRELIKGRLQNEASAAQNINIGEDTQMQDIDGNFSLNAVNDMRDLFQHQINLEIKLQHETLNEVRCEIAKSQIALEQLRRCHLIPFPQAYADPEAMLNIMEGAGPSVPTTEGKMPRWASPFGVTEGAYTRHYAKWLIPDERFDGVVWDKQMMQGSGYPFPNMAAVNGEIVRMDGRQTRNSFQLDPVPKNKRSRGVITAPLQALSSGYAQKREDAGPSVLKRGDGQWVKLVCIDCQRENFGSTQGFINHCRIAHRREFKSHEEAAVNSGHLVEVDNLGGLVGEEKIPASACYEGLVHHKIKQAPLDWTAAKSVLQHVNDALRKFREGKLKGVDRIPGERRGEGLDVEEKPSKDFTPAAATPHLSALLAKTGFNRNLSSSVDAAKTPTPEDIAITYNTEDSDDEMADTPVVAPASIKKFLNGRGKPTQRISCRPPILPSMRPSSSSSGATSGAASKQTPILPIPRLSLTVRPQSSLGKKAKGLDMISQEIAGLEAQAKAKASEVQIQGSNKSPKDMAQAKAREVQSRINEAARNIKQARIAQKLAGEEAEEVLVVGVGVLRGGGAGARSDGDADSPVDLDMDDLSATAHSEGDKAPSLVSDDDDYTAESHDESYEDGEEGEEESEGEGIEVRDESDEARSRKRTQSREEESINVGRGNGKGQAKKGVTLASPVSSTKNKGRAMGKVRK